MAARNVLAPLVIGLVITLVAGVLWWRAEDAVLAARHRLTEHMLRRVFPLSYDNDLYRDRLTFSDTRKLEQSVPLYGYVFRHMGAVVGIVYTPVIVRGYQSDIKLAIGMDRDGVVTGVTVLSHDETATLGDGITRDSFLKPLHGSDADSRWDLRRDGGAYNGVSGATISSRAVVYAVRDTLLFHAEVQPQLFDKVAPP